MLPCITANPTETLAFQGLCPQAHAIMPTPYDKPSSAKRTKLRVTAFEFKKKNPLKKIVGRLETNHEVLYSVVFQEKEFTHGELGVIFLQ